MRSRSRILALGLLGLAAGAAWASARPQPAPWSLGRVDVRVVRAGWRRDPKTRTWAPEVELRFVNRDLKHPFHRPVLVEFIGTGGRAWDWKTFVTLAPGSAQHRRIDAPGRLNRVDGAGGFPPMGLRVELSKRDRTEVHPLPAVALADLDAPPAGQELYVAAVEDGAVIRLLDGRRVRPLGVRCNAGGQARAAAAWTRARVMDSPVTLAYGGRPQDRPGRWPAYITLSDGRDLGAELLRRSLAVPSTGAPCGRTLRYRAIARKAAKGFFKAS